MFKRIVALLLVSTVLLMSVATIAEESNVEFTEEVIVVSEPDPTPEPTAVPTPEPTAEPTAEPTPEPTVEPTAEPTPEPTAESTAEPTPEPTAEPTAEPTPEPTVEPTAEPTPEPTVEPTAEPTPEPVVEPEVFSAGYVLVSSGAKLYAAPSDAEAIGSFSDDSVVYAVVEDNEWLWIVFDTQSASNADEALPEGYVLLSDAEILSADALSLSGELRSYEGNLLPIVSYEAFEEEVVVPTAEPTIEPTTEPTVEPTAEPTEIPEEIVKGEENNPDLLPAPSNVQVVPASHDSVTITWDAVEGAELYKLYRSVNGSPFTFVKNVDGTSTGNFNMSSNTVYAYQICAVRTVNGSHELGNMSASASITLSLLPAPQNFHGETLASGGVDLKWDAVDGAAGYRLYRSINGGASTLVKSVDKNAASNFNLDLTNNTYSYQIAALADVNGVLVRGELSDPIIFQDRPAAPCNVKAVITSDGAYLSWDAVSNANNYRIYRSIDGADFKLLKDSATNWATTTVDLSKTYAYMVVAIRNEEDVIIKSTNSAVAELQYQFATPSNVKLQHLDANRIEIRWDAVEGANYYRIYRSTNGGAYTLLKGLSLTNTANYNLNNKENIYSYQIMAMKTNENGKDIVSAKSEPVTIDIMPEAPLNLTVQKQNNTAVDLNWDAVEGATSYRLYRSIDDAPLTLVKSVSGTSTSTYSLDLSNHFYRFFVSAIIEDEATTRRSPYSVSATIGLDMPAPANIVATASEDGSVVLTWDAVNHATGYKVFMAVNDGEYEMTLVEGTSNTYTGLDLTANTYSFKVSAICKLSDTLTLDGAESEPVVLEPVVEEPEPEEPVIPEMPAPADVSAEQTGEGEVTITWTDGDEEGYVVMYATAEDGDYTLLGETTDASYVVSNLETGSTYWFKVAAYATVEDQKYVSENASICSITIAATEKTYGDFVYDYTEDNGIVIVRYTGNDAVVVVPEAIEGLNVTVIGDSAFEGNTTLTSIDLPDTVEKISVRAFADCTNLSSME